MFDPNSTNVSQVTGFEKAGCNVIRYAYREREKVLGAKGRDKEIVELARGCDLVLMSKCNGVGASVVSECQKLGAKVVLWYMDPMWNFTPEMENRVADCDRTFCALTEPYKKAKEIAPERVHFLQEGFDADVDKPWSLPFKYDVTFIGNINHVKKRRDYASRVKFKVITGVYGDDHAKTVSQSRINLNFTHGGTSDRSYKILAAGGFLLTEPWPDMDRDFEPGRDFDTFEGHRELDHKIRYWLANPEGRERVRLRGMATVQKFNRDEWARRILETL